MRLNEILDPINEYSVHKAVSFGKRWPVFQNPTPEMVANLRRKAEYGARALFSRDGNNAFVWDANGPSHLEAITQLDLPPRDYYRMVFDNKGDNVWNPSYASDRAAYSSKWMKLFPTS